MKKLSWIGFGALLGLAFSQIDCSQKSRFESSLTNLVAAERQFAYTSETNGIRQAFLTFLAEEAILFRPRPIKGKALYHQSPTIPGMLTWHPIFAAISAAGDLGYTTGPFEFRKGGGTTNTDGYGHYVSMWKQQTQGEWRVVLDAGISHGKPDSTRLESLTLLPGPVKKFNHRNDIAMTAEKNTVLELERQLAQAAGGSAGFLAALRSFCAPNPRIYRDNHLPALTWSAAVPMLNQGPALLEWQAPTVEISASGDLAYSYGIATAISSSDSATAQISFSFLRIWQKQEDQIWKIVLDLATAIPPESEPKPAN